MIFAPPRTHGALYCGLLGGCAGALGLALIVRGMSLQVSFGQFLADTVAFLLLAAAIPLAYWAYAVASLHYELAGDSLVIRWGLNEHVVPLVNVERVILGRHLALPLVRGLRLPGVAVGRASVSKIGSAIVYLRYRKPADLVYLETVEGRIGLSLQEVQPFVRALQQVQADLAGWPAGESGVRRAGPSRLGLLADGRARLLGSLSLVLAWLSAAIVYARFQGRPPALTLHFPPTEPAHLAPRADLLQIPESAIVWCAVAGIAALALYNHARIAAYLVLAGSAIGGAILVVAALVATA